ncbi:chemotaxis protein CheW [Methylobacterium sp. NEAU 140]|uniref:chemotaxis protein CheW n=1 Tax=Methylobacterium sp. NEAU 140 TaxID=3064945 RepID=UPI00273307B4|nr:chemotaxis protein CheW [Methylobacterium sp. NEAU 140]MDP4025059.1 chemotaxis protein CheW [Methylobacterium sp. NEAU 140]
MSGTAYLLLDVAGTPCALPRAAAAEVLPLPDLHRPPAAGGWLAGFLNLGGAPVPVIDLAGLLGLRAAPAEPGLYAHLVLAEDRSRAYLVDRVADLVSVPDDARQPVAEAESLNGCVAAEIALGGGLVHALDPERLLTARERARVEALARAEADRLAALPDPLPAPLPATEPA